MTEEQKTQIKDKIEKRMTQLESDILDLQEQTKPIAPENAIGRISRMDAINNRSVNLSTLRESRSNLIKLNHSLSKIDDPSFGNCARCGNEIAFQRLMFRPESTRCVKCAAR